VLREHVDAWLRGLAASACAGSHHDDVDGVGLAFGFTDCAPNWKASMLLMVQDRKA
jgi:hypothetical protein